MIDWNKGTWQQGDKARYHQGRGEPMYCEVHAGLYWYSGFGQGTFFRPDGTMGVGYSPQEAHAEARALGVPFRYVDSFVPSSFTSVGG